MDASMKSIPPVDFTISADVLHCSSFRVYGVDSENLLHLASSYLSSAVGFVIHTQFMMIGGPRIA
jgi:hypothetical protein